MTIKEIKKRDGRTVEFNKAKIADAIFKAARAVGGEDYNLAEKLADIVLKRVEKSIAPRVVPTVEEVQDAVEKTLIEGGHAKTAKAYILYRDQRTKIRELKSLTQDIDIIEGYISEEDWRVKENSNMTFSLQGLDYHISSKIISHYWLEKIYPSEIRNAHNSGDFHIHDLGTLGAYCVGWDLLDLLLNGFKGVSGKIETKPPRHLRSALGQAVNFFYTLQGESAGAQAMSNFDTYLAPFIRYDKLNYDEVKQAIQEFIFNMNVPTRVGFQTPFSNITLDMVVPGHMKNEPVIIGGKPMNETYGDFQEELKIFDQAFAEVMMEGDAKGRPFTFPIPTICITKDFDWNNTEEKIWGMTAKYGIPYFSNFINSDMKPDDVRSMCCRLRIDNRELRKRGGGLFGANPLTGCYDEETEILTEDGWKYFRDLTKKDTIFTLIDDNKIELHKPKKLFAYDYEGEMFHFKTKSLDLLVTPNHRMVVDHVQSRRRKFVEAQNFDANNQRIPKQSIWEGVEEEFFILPGIEFTKYGRQGRTPYQVNRDALKIKMDNWLKFFGFWLAEGCTDNEKIAKRHGYRVVISQVNKQKRKEIKEVLDVLPFNYYLEGCNFVICNKQLWTYLRKFGNKYQKYIPHDIKKISKRQIKILFDWMVKGDGHVRKTTGQINYWTASKKLADDLQEIILKLGWLGTLTAQKKNISEIKGRKINAGIVYTIGVQKASHYRLRKNNIKKVNYKGKVYCCEVDNHTVFVRRNGRVSWCGNSIGVVTINMPRIGFNSETEEDFFKHLEHLMLLAEESLEIKRKALEKFTDAGLYPYSKFYLRKVKESEDQYWKNHFSTIGLVGMNEAILNLKGKTIADPEGRDFALKVLEFMRNKLQDFQQETGHIYNLEATPAEGTSYRLAMIDKRTYPNIIVANDEQAKAGAAPFYTNSTQLPVNYTDDIFEALQIQDDIQTKYTGGVVFHGFLGEAMPSVEATKKLVKRIAENFHLPYFTITPTYSICPNHGYMSGRHDFCPQCNGQKVECEVYSRIVGYIRPIKQWNAGKRSEFEMRTTFNGTASKA